MLWRTEKMYLANFVITMAIAVDLFLSEEILWLKAIKETQIVALDLYDFSMKILQFISSINTGYLWIIHNF